MTSLFHRVQGNLDNYSKAKGNQINRKCKMIFYSPRKLNIIFSCPSYYYKRMKKANLKKDQKTQQNWNHGKFEISCNWQKGNKGSIQYFVEISNSKIFEESGAPVIRCLEGCLCYNLSHQ